MTSTQRTTPDSDKFKRDRPADGKTTEKLSRTFTLLVDNVRISTPCGRLRKERKPLSHYETGLPGLIAVFDRVPHASHRFIQQFVRIIAPSIDGLPDSPQLFGSQHGFFCGRDGLGLRSTGIFLFRRRQRIGVEYIAGGVQAVW